MSYYLIKHIKWKTVAQLHTHAQTDIHIKYFLSKDKKKSLLWCHYKFISGCDDPNQMLHEKNYFGIFILLTVRIRFEKIYLWLKKFFN